MCRHLVKYIHTKYAKICIWENKSLQKLVSSKSFNGVKYVMWGHIFVNQVFQFCESIGALRRIIFDSITLK